MSGTRTIAGRTLYPHILPMRFASFIPIEADLIAANRLHFWTSLKWKRAVWSYALGGLVFAFIASLFTEWDGPENILFGATVGLTFWSLLLIGILTINYALIPHRSRRVFQQMKKLASQTEISWSPDSIQLQSEQGSADFDWRDFMQIAQGQDVTLLYQSDYVFNFIPRRALSDKQARDISDLAIARRG